MKFSEVVEARRSVRKFLPEAIPEAVVEEAIRLALLAANSSNMQAWEFYWLRDSDKKKALVTACFSQPAAATAAEIIVCVARTDTWKRNLQLMKEELAKLPKVPHSATKYYESVVPMMYGRGFLGLKACALRMAMWCVGWFRPVPRGFGRKSVEEVVIKSAALACENIMLSIVDQGYASCPMEGFDEVRVKRVLGLGCGARVVMCLGMGKPDPKGVYGPRIRFDPKLFVHRV